MAFIVGNPMGPNDLERLGLPNSEQLQEMFIDAINKSPSINEMQALQDAVDEYIHGDASAEEHIHAIEEMIMTVHQKFQDACDALDEIRKLHAKRSRNIENTMQYQAYMATLIVRILFFEDTLTVLNTGVYQSVKPFERMHQKMVAHPAEYASSFRRTLPISESEAISIPRWLTVVCQAHVEAIAEMNEETTLPFDMAGSTEFMDHVYDALLNENDMDPAVGELYHAIQPMRLVVLSLLSDAMGNYSEYRTPALATTIAARWTNSFPLLANIYHDIAGNTDTAVQYMRRVWYKKELAAQKDKQEQVAIEVLLSTLSPAES